MRVASLTFALLVANGVTAAAQSDMTPPRIVAEPVDWPAATKMLEQDGTSLEALNAAISKRFPGIAQSSVPVLLPFDTDALRRDQAAGSATDNSTPYLSGFEASKFFDTGAAGYDASFTFRTADVPEFADIKFAYPIEVLISGSRLTYRLDAPTRVESGPKSEPALESNFPGIRRLILEHHLRYTFERYGATYVVSIACFDAGVSRYKMPTCRAADRVATRFLNALRVAGGSASAPPTAEPVHVERPSEPSGVFSYFGPGRLLSGTGFRGEGGRADTTAYSQIRFPLADAPAYANTQMFQRRNPTPNYAYPWRDNFCERRGFPVGQCPAGIGHQGQDIRAAPCVEARGERCERPREIVAVRDGAIWRSFRQEAAYLVVNTASEHIRFRYLHMIPRDMDADNLLSGRRVQTGETIGHVGNFSNKEGGTSYHLHFDVQVFTRDGWVFVNPYMTLVNAYERLIHGRGEEITDPALVAATEAAPERPRIRRARHGRRVVHRPRAHRRPHLALH